MAVKGLSKSLICPCKLQTTSLIIVYSLIVGIVITTHPQEQLVIVNGSVNFTCEAPGSQPITYRWMYNGNYVMNDPGHIEGANTSTLMIVNILVTDWGVYSCEASNVVNNVTSDEATLHGMFYTSTYIYIF